MVTAPAQQTNGSTQPSTPAPVADDYMSNIDAVLDEDGDMYDDGTGDDVGGVGDDPDSVGDGSGAADGAVSRQDAQTRQTQDARREPELPMQLPKQPAPPAPRYDADNPRGYHRVGTLFADEKGNIVSRDGRIMAAAGEPARHWFNMSKQVAAGQQSQRQVEALNKQIQDQQGLIAAAKELSELPQKLGISRDDYNMGVQLVAAWNKNPLEVCRDMVARTMARGFNATDIIGNDAGNAVEMTALRKMIDEATAGQRQREETDRVSSEARANAERNYNAFIARYPVAAVHTDIIATLMRQNKMSAPEAYHELRYFALENQLDFAQPLGPQMEARRAAAVQPAPPAYVPPQPDAATYRAPMVNGGGGGRRDHLTHEPAMADANSSWGDILNSVMRQSA